VKKQPQFMVWYDDNPKVATEEKIAEAMDAFVRSKRWRDPPNLVLVNEADVVAVQHVTVRSAAYIRRNNFWVGFEDIAVLEPEVKKRASRSAA
jgi:hypothetical protein